MQIIELLDAAGASLGIARQKNADELGTVVANVYRILKKQATPQRKTQKPAKRAVEKKKKADCKTESVQDTGQLSMF